MAATTQPIHKTALHSFIWENSYTGDVTDEKMPELPQGMYLTQVEVKSSVDNALTITINSGGLGAEQASGTGDFTTAAYLTLSAYRYIVGVPTITIANLGSGTLSVIISAVS